ncbi:hypothetical protein BH09VER1_BH09VER1_17620 [soil metagenome]
MPTEFLVAQNGRVYSSQEVDCEILRKRHLYKSISLLEANRSGIVVPPTLLLLDSVSDYIADMASKWVPPLMIRMDYDTRPPSKPIGGIPAYSIDVIRSLSTNLFGQGLYPLFHPHIDRFSDIYSAGVLLRKHDTEIQIELVGQGFDAADLRLGSAIPHESFRYDMAEDSIYERRQIGKDIYHSQRLERAHRIAELRRYIDFANRECRLASSLSHFNPSPSEIAEAENSIRAHYIPLEKREIKALAGIAFVLQNQVLPHLPSSEYFAASLSLISGRGWILWDVYGHWYER